MHVQFLINATYWQQFFGGSLETIEQHKLLLDLYYYAKRCCFDFPTDKVRSLH